MKNPFLYGEEVTGEYFCNRKQEIGQFVKYAQNSNKVLLYSPRRWGKTSLIKEVVSRLPQKSCPVIYADLYAVSNEDEFIQTVAGAFAKAFAGPLDKIVHALKNILKSFIPKIMLEPSGETSIEFGFDSSKNKFALAEELLDAISSYMKKKHKGLIIFDEFQQIGELATDRLEKILRSKIQSHRHIAYIFAGSKRHLLFKMFSDPGRPFYKSAIHFPLGPIPDEELMAFISRRFKSANLKISPEAARYALDMGESHPYHVQQLCFHVCNSSEPGQTIINRSIDEARERILSEESASHQNVFDLLNGGQRQAIRALSKLSADETPFSASFVQRAKLKSADSFRKGLESLVEKNVVEKENGAYAISDIFFKKWLSRLP